ncbi:MAG: heme-binding protein [Alphaproteobacteria bacterium]|nr:heme-binding protein [Alphaproteobacteria bacterium]
MNRFALILAAACGVAVVSVPVWAQQQQPASAAVPDKMPFDIPYGAPISVETAKRGVEAALAEATKRGWKMAISVVSPSGDLTFFLKMDDTQLASAAIAPRKARAAARFRRETKVFFDAMESGHPYVGALDPDVTASPGGIPIVIGGKLVGAMGCSGGTGAQDAVVCQAGIDALGK